MLCYKKWLFSYMLSIMVTLNAQYAQFYSLGRGNQLFTDGIKPVGYLSELFYA